MKLLRLSKNRKEIECFLSKRERNLTEQIPVVREICENVRKNGDDAILKYAKKFDGTTFKKGSQLKIKKQEIKDSYKKVDTEFIHALEIAKKNIERFHSKQKAGKESWHEEEGGCIFGEKYTPIEKVGVYVPGGKASYPSTVLMNIIPAKIAGVEEIIVATPEANPCVLVAADISGASGIFRMGGAQAIAAMAFGTETVPKVNKIVGPGNIFVALSKLLVQQETSVGIDMVAGPTEVVILLDEQARVNFAVADMLAQAEHGMKPFVILITTSEEIAGQISREIKKQIRKLNRAEIIQECLGENAAIIIAKNIDEAIEFANVIAPEHLELQVAMPWECLKKVKNAGAVFLGDYSPEPLGDYLAGPNHVLPTGGRAKFSSPLGVDDFMKKTNFVFSDKTYLKKSADAVIKLAECEGLDAHAEAVRIRLRK